MLDDQDGRVVGLLLGEVPVDAEQPRLGGQLDPDLLPQLPAQGIVERFLAAHTATGQVPALPVGVLDEQHAAGFVHDQSQDADRDRPHREPVGAAQTVGGDEQRVLHAPQRTMRGR